ncbi:MFS transporter [Pseudomonas sp. SDI]|uniref:MFS transporter n=1 Tax=Pseudomonas sp. SDI TaxID=2170734 RepID=UPI000DE7B6E4|nr:MFS transporter [Pseudomonas sp. SDI]PWB33993.1 MFS transporter [Pseudomonas sp. SDI]
MIIGCALCMELIDATVVMTALPQMAREFEAPSVRMNLVVSLYLLAAALFVPVSGWAADRFGPKRLFQWAIVLFGVASLACALSSTLLQLCLARMLQGVAGAMMVPVGQVLLLRWSPRAELMRNLSYLTIPALIGPILGPPLGGLMVTFLSWHWIFLVNLPIAVLGLLLVQRHIPAFPGVRGEPLDGRGLLLSGIGLGALVFGFEVLGHRLLPLPWGMALLLIGGVSGALYIRHARRCARPLLDLSLLRIPSFGISFWGGNLLRLGTASGPFLLVLLFQSCFGMSPLAAGLLTLAGGAGAFLMKLLALRVVRRFGIRRTLTVNALFTGVSLAACAWFSIDTPYWLIVLMLFVSALIRSLQFSTLGALTYADVPAQLSSRASSLQAMTVQLSMSLSVGMAAALLGLLMSVRGHASLLASDVAWVMLLGGVACVASGLLFRRLPADAGRGVYAP